MQQTGMARGVVIGTGDRTLMGRIASIAARMEVGEETLIAHEIGHFVRVITGISVFVSLLFFFLSLIVGFYWVDALIYLVGLILACVPEGILPTITVRSNVSLHCANREGFYCMLLLDAVWNAPIAFFHPQFKGWLHIELFLHFWLCILCLPVVVFCVLGIYFNLCILCASFCASIYYIKIDAVFSQQFVSVDTAVFANEMHLH